MTALGRLTDILRKYIRIRVVNGRKLTPTKMFHFDLEGTFIPIASKFKTRAVMTIIYPPSFLPDFAPRKT